MVLTHFLPTAEKGSGSRKASRKAAEKGSGLEKRILSYLLVVAIFPFQGLTPYPLLRRLAKDAGRKVFLILDNLKVHHSKAVKEWLEKNKEKTEVFYLPSYSPELNPDEYLNNSLKGRVHSGKRAQNANQLESKARKHMRNLQNNQHKTKKFFMHPCVAYAA